MRILLIIIIVITCFVYLWYGTDFPILYCKARGFHIFNGQNLIADTNPRLIKGLKNVINLDIIFVGIVRNVDKFLETNLLRIKKLENVFNKITYFLYENDSTDNTVKILEKWSKYKNFHYLSQKTSDPLPVSYGAHSLRRFVKMALLRNKYVEWLRGLEKQPNYVVVMDWDLKGGIDTNGFVSAFSSLNWDVMFANGMDCKYKYNPIIEMETIYDPLAYEDYFGKRIKGHSVKPCKTYCSRPFLDPLIPIKYRVNSSFSGLAIYKADIFTKYNYDPVEPIDCEHIMLHRQLKGKKLLINSELFLVR